VPSNFTVLFILIVLGLACFSFAFAFFLVCANLFFDIISIKKTCVRVIRSFG